MSRFADFLIGLNKPEVRPMERLPQRGDLRRQRMADAAVSLDDLRADAEALENGGQVPETPRPIHPGEILWEEFMKPLGLKAPTTAKAMGVPRTRIERLVAGQTALSLRQAPDVLDEPAGRLRCRSDAAGHGQGPGRHPAPDIEDGDGVAQTSKRKRARHFGRAPLYATLTVTLTGTEPRTCGRSRSTRCRRPWCCCSGNRSGCSRREGRSCRRRNTRRRHRN
jgi:hypothetical protein